jgi:hypothetical protein
MKIRVGRFTCELSLNDRGEVEATWLPGQPRYLSREERAQYRAGRAAFLARASHAKTAAIPLALPPLQAIALAQFVKRVDFETVARFAPVTVVCNDGKSEADLVWLALIALRGALAEAASKRAEGGELVNSSRENAEVVVGSLGEMEGKAPPWHPFPDTRKGMVQVMPGTDLTKPSSQCHQRFEFHLKPAD